MSRSLKKGPYVEPRLLERIIAMNEAGEKNVIKTWSRSSTIFPEMWVTPSPCMMVVVMFPSTSPSRWSDTSWASSPPSRTFRAHKKD